MKRFIFVLCVLSSVLCGFAAQPAAVQRSTEAATLNDVLTDLNIAATRSVTFKPSSTLTINGVLGGTPTSGTLNLSNLTLTLPAATIGLFQPLDGDLTSIAALSTTANGRSLLTASTLTHVGLGLTNGAAADSWAAVTRASGFDTFAAAPSSANLRSVLTDETGTGTAVFNTLPTFATSLGVSYSNTVSAALGRYTWEDATTWDNSVLSLSAAGFDTSAASFSPFIRFFRARGTLAAPTAVQQDDYLGALSSIGQGTTTHNAHSDVGIVLSANGNWTDSSHPTKIQFLNTAPGATQKYEVARFTATDQIIGTNSPTDSLEVGNGIKASFNGATGIQLDSYSSSGGANPLLMGRRASGSLASPSAVAGDQALLALLGRGYGTNAFGSNNVAAILLSAAETFTDSAQGTYISFGTTATSSTSRVERARITPAGNLLIGVTADSAFPFGSGLMVARDAAASIVAAANGTGVNPVFMGQRARGTLASPSAVKSSDILFDLQGRGYGANAYSSGGLGGVRLAASENYTNSAQGTRLSLRVTPDSSTTAFEAVAVRPDGQLVIVTAKTPASASAAGEAGTIAWDSSFIYICTATNTWKRVAISTW